MLQYLCMCNVIVSKPTSAKRRKSISMMKFYSNCNENGPGPSPKSIDFMLHGGFLSAGWCIFNRYHMIARKGQLLLTHRSGQAGWLWDATEFLIPSTNSTDITVWIDLRVFTN